MAIDTAPIVTVGDDFVITATLTDDANPTGAILTGATINAFLRGPTGTQLIGSTAQSSSTAGANWATGIVVVVFPKAGTAALATGDAYVEYQVTLGGIQQTFEPKQIQIVAQGTGIIPQVLTPNEKAIVFEIFGIPPMGQASAYSLISTLFGPAGETYDHTRLVTDLNTRLDALTPPHVQRARLLTTRWDEIGSTRQVLITKSATGTEGIIQDDHAERAIIRKRLMTVTGFWCPKGGFETEKSGGGRRIIR